ncbi:hypothetical protein Mp_5g08590 [Marchantia polymorpha subsp. ruderalis]|uniref:Uncharacterized protein n=2 Tax=Marchantia polymorpha TaxID=3197 RepID=A0AAF6BGB2_MARPO|nr:hypothetical protein MARPO_0086s0064 [Marchantia polymorpha]BBN11046.1 hypothetical protein Mp_5g08590 [Marchantia polymorpha subsp. ruderalis]|eukprot:PTQ33745.1 hypothetical protein MARPO_0086s0064 [Marchantia polymorpha]
MDWHRGRAFSWPTADWKLVDAFKSHKRTCTDTQDFGRSDTQQLKRSKQEALGIKSRVELTELGRRTSFRQVGKSVSLRVQFGRVSKREEFPR